MVKGDRSDPMATHCINDSGNFSWKKDKLRGLKKAKKRLLILQKYGVNDSRIGLVKLKITRMEEING